MHDQLGIRAAAPEPFVLPDYDQESFDALRAAVHALGRYLGGPGRTFGTPASVDPVRHLVGTAVGWGGMPGDEALYVAGTPGLPVGTYRLTMRDVRVDAFWSISVYGPDGFFAPNDRNAYSVMAERNPDGSVSVHFAGCGGGRPNCLPIAEGLGVPDPAVAPARRTARRDVGDTAGRTRHRLDRPSRTAHPVGPTLRTHRAAGRPVPAPAADPGWAGLGGDPAGSRAIIG